MPYCPKCRNKHEEEKQECPDCGSRLVDQLTEEVPPESPNFVPLRNLPSRMYAQMLQEALRKEGIPSMTKSDDIAITFPSLGTTSAVPVIILVSEKDAKRADEIADQMLDHI
jgi:hypothetical protein